MYSLIVNEICMSSSFILSILSPVFSIVILAWVLTKVIQNEKVGHLSYIDAIVVLLPANIINFIYSAYVKLDTPALLTLSSIAQIAVTLTLFYFMLGRHFKLDFKKVIKIYALMLLISFAIGIVLGLVLQVFSPFTGWVGKVI